MKFQDLAIKILAINGSPISKVRFAKTTYFVFKDLVANGLASEHDICFIRMPLGPVPDGLMTLTDDCKNINIINEPVKHGLMYNTQKYLLTPNSKKQILANLDTHERQVISKTLSAARQKTTAKLVEISHQDQSWQQHKNGDTYYIIQNDLKNLISGFSFFNKQKKDFDSKEQAALQSCLVKGMLSDIVEESTALEH